MSGAPFTGVFLDGRTAIKRLATLTVEGGELTLRWEQGQRTFGVDEVHPVHPCQRGVQFVHLVGGGTCEMPASSELLALLTQAGVAVQKQSAMMAALHGDWRIASMALAFLAGVIAAFYVWLLPMLAEFCVHLVPANIERGIGETALRQVETQWLSPSKLTSSQQGAIQERFELLTRDLSGQETPGLELRIRKSRIGPNAFALPGNIIVLTDDLVTLVDGDLDAIAGVVAHELGHLKHQHGLRSAVQATALTILGSALIGDYSSAMAAIPATLGHLHYSRHFETEADVYARDALCEAGIDPAKTALFFVRAAKIEGNVAELIPTYLSSHPDSQERAAYFRKPCPLP